MPGGNPDAWPARETDLSRIAAKARRWPPLLRLGGRWGRRPLCENGPQWHRIWRYAADLRSLSFAEKCSGCSCDELHTIFTDWNKGALNSYLIEITAQIFAHQRYRWQAAARQNSRCRWTKRDREMDRDQRAGSGNACDVDCRSSFCPMSLRVER